MILPILLLIVISVLSGLTGCSLSPPHKPVVIKPATKPLEGHDVTFTVTEQGKKRWILHADQATYSPDMKLADLNKVHGEVFDTKGKLVATFESSKGQYEQSKKWITLTDGVKASSAGDEKTSTRLTAPIVIWKTGGNDADAIHGVTIDRKAFGISTADHCKFSLDFSRIALSGNAITQVK